MADPKNNDDIATLSFEQALAELEDIVNRLERGDVALEESISIYQRGNALRALCDAKLKAAEARIEKVIDDGKTVAPFDAA